jgi:hypothetical protein
MHKYLLSAFVSAGLLCQGASLTLTSNATETFNDSGISTVNIANLPSFWGTPFGTSHWVSYVQSGDPGAPGYVQVPSEHFVTFVDFFISDAAATGGIDVMADDVTNVTLNGIVLADYPDETEGSCSTLPIGCTHATSKHINLTPALLHAGGLDVLTFTVEEDSGTPFGLDYSGSISAGLRATTPEPASLALAALPLLGLAIWRRKKRA